MRLAAQVKGGYYAAHENAVAYAAKFLLAPQGGPFTILDPCAGEGRALRQLGELLNCPANQLFGIELDDSRAEALRTAIPTANILAPANFLGCRTSFGSFPFIWLNPPFDEAYGGNRVEEEFLWKATDWLIPGGVMAFVCPEDVIGEYTDARRYFMAHYENCRIEPFPEEHRPYREAIVFGHKRKRPLGRDDASSRRKAWDSVRAPEWYRYRIPAASPPRVFQKVEPTETELQRMLAKSPLRTHLRIPPARPLPSPPLPLGIGHVALLLASGHLNGVVQPDGQPPHVVRGTARKRAVVTDVADTENDDGSTTTRTTIAEQIDLVIRTVDGTGHIATYSQGEPEKGNPATIPAAGC